MREGRVPSLTRVGRVPARPRQAIHTRSPGLRMNGRILSQPYASRNANAPPMDFQSIGGAFMAPEGASRLPFDRSLELGTRTEHRSLLRRNGHRFAGLRIATLSC